MRYGIMGAMPEEVNCLRSHMANVQEIEQGSRKYYLGKLGAHEVVLVFSRWGKVAAAATATSLITEFKVDQLIFTGVAGAADPRLNIGDVVISSQLYQHDMDASPLFKKFEIPLTGITFFEADPKLKDKAYCATTSLFASLASKIPAASLEKFNITKPQCCLGIIATGDEFISSIARTQAILTEVPETMAVEMEGAAVAQICYDYTIPFVVIRTISDKADHNAVLDFPAFINEIAQHYSEHIMMKMLEF